MSQAEKENHIDLDKLHRLLGILKYERDVAVELFGEQKEGMVAWELPKELDDIGFLKKIFIEGYIGMYGTGFFMLCIYIKGKGLAFLEKFGQPKTLEADLKERIENIPLPY